MKPALCLILSGVLVGALGLTAGCARDDDSKLGANASDAPQVADAADPDPAVSDPVSGVEAEPEAVAEIASEKVESIGSISTPLPKPHPQGRKAPEFNLTTLDGERITLAELAGQVVLVDFWATWCGPCRRSIPHLIELQNELGERGLVIVGVSLDRGGPDIVRRYVERMGINYPVAMGSAALTQAYGGDAGIRFIPTAFLVDREGYIAKTLTGLQPKATMRQEILRVLEG